MDESADASATTAGGPPAHPPPISHPRRPPAHKSVSLLHSSMAATPQDAVNESHLGARKHRGRTPVSNKASLGPSLSAIPANPDKSGSSGESSNAEKWFEKSNNNPRSGSADLMDSDPPFFLRNSSSSEASPDMLDRERENQRALDSLPHRTGLMQLDTAASSSEDFRSVIDDLTVQNKKLKRKLKKYEKLHDAHLQNDKLFEIRVHGLPPHKKRELEETLQKFAAGLSSAPVNSSPGVGLEKVYSVPPAMEQQLTATSSLGNVDSAYASASGHQSSMQSGHGSSTNAVQKKGVQAKSSGMSSAQQRDIQIYLSDIPQGLLPKPVAMTEKSKKKVIVRRLEQIFAGKGATMEGHQQPLQQEEISQSAARADRNERHASGRLVTKEGSREARIMAGKRRALQATNAEVPQVEVSRPKAPAKDISTIDFSQRKPGGGTSPDQRPTRPLDLDPNRAQVPEDNIKYLRHLGFSPLEAGSDQDLIDGHGYMYLNVLINMAQLHTLNVTPELVKKAIEQYSKKLELTNDGRKVRWKGGSALTRTSSNGSPDDNSGSGKSLAPADSRTKGGLPSASGYGSSESISHGKPAKEPENKLAYVPLFFHQDDDDDDDSDNMSEWSSPHEELAAADSSGLTSSGMRTSSSRKRQANDGPIIFYNRAPFVTDLSGDWRGASVLRAANVQDYSTAPIHAVGIPPEPTSKQAEGKGPLSKVETTSPPSSDSMELDDNVSGDSMRGFSKPPSIKTATSSTESIEPMEFEASGVGGVHPSDNFALSVKSRHRIGGRVDPTGRAQSYPPRIRAILAEEQSQWPAPKMGQSQGVSGEILSSKRRDLPPSELPPPSYFPISSPEDEEEFSDFEDGEDDMSDSPVYNSGPLPMAAPQAIKWPVDADATEGEDDDSDDEEEYDSDEDDGSPDMLAHARMANPELVRMAEREYDAALAERMAKDIPAGSSAATAGGGSGYNSPATPLRMDIDTSPAQDGAPQSGENATQPQRGILKRPRGGGGPKNTRASKSPKLDKANARG